MPYPVKIQFLSLACQDVKVVMSTSVSAKRKLHQSSAFFSINYLQVRSLFSRNFIFFIAVTFRIQINATCFPILDRTQDFYRMQIDSTNKRLVQGKKLLSWYFINVYKQNKQNITCFLVDTNFIFLCSTRYFTRSLRSLVRYQLEHSKIKFVSTISSIY